MKKLIMQYMLIVVLLTLTACDWDWEELREGYQPGDALHTALRLGSEARSLHEKYCKETDPLIKEVLITAVRAEVPFYPDEGICSLDFDATE